MTVSVEELAPGAEPLDPETAAAVEELVLELVSDSLESLSSEPHPASTSDAAVTSASARAL